VVRSSLSTPSLRRFRILVRFDLKLAVGAQKKAGKNGFCGPLYREGFETCGVVTLSLLLTPSILIFRI